MRKVQGREPAIRIGRMLREEGSYEKER